MQTVRIGSSDHQRPDCVNARIANYRKLKLEYLSWGHIEWTIETNKRE